MDAALIFDIDSSRARTAATDLAKLQNAATRLSGSWAKTETAIRRSNGQFASSAEVVEKYGREVQELAAKYNPALDAVYKFQRAEAEVNRAIALGVLTKEQAARALDDVSTRLRASANASAIAKQGMQQLAQGADVARHHVANLSFQLNDIGMMMALGQSPFMLMMQQGPQVAQILGQMSAEGRKLGPTLAGAFKMFLNPMTAATLAVIGGTAALYQFITASDESEKEARTLSDTMDELSSSVSDHKTALEEAKAPISDLIKDYGLLAGVAREALENMADIKAYNAMILLNDAIKENIDEITEYRQFSTGNFLEQAETALVLKNAYGLVGSEVGKVRNAILELNGAQGAVERIVAAQNLSREMESAYGSIEAMPKEMRALYENLQNVISQGSALVSQTDDWASAMRSVLSYVNAIGASLSSIGSTGISYAAARVETEALRAGKSLRDASLAAARETARLEGEQRTGELREQYGIWGQILGATEAAAKQAEISQKDELERIREIRREEERESNRKGRSGGGGARKEAAELRAAEKGFQSIRELMEKESIFQFAEYEKRQKQLDTALSKRLLSQEAYEKMASELRTMYFAPEFERNLLQYQMDQEALQSALDQKLITEEEYFRKRREMQWSNLLSEQNRSDLAVDLQNWGTYFGQLQSMTGGNFDALARIQKAFAASSALVNAYLAASQTLADPTLGFWGKMAAYGKVLAAGMGLVSAIKGGGSGGGVGGGGASAASASTQVARQDPTKYVTVRFDGPEWMRDGVESLLDEIYDQSKNGRVIIARDT